MSGFSPLESKYNYDKMLVALLKMAFLLAIFVYSNDVKQWDYALCIVTTPFAWVVELTVSLLKHHIVLVKSKLMWNWFNEVTLSKWSQEANSQWMVVLLKGTLW